MSAPPPTSRANKHISALSTAPTLVDAAGASESAKGINEKRFSDDKILKSEVVNTVQPVSPSEEPSRVASPEQADVVVVVHFQAGDPNDPRVSSPGFSFHRACPLTLSHVRTGRDGTAGTSPSSAASSFSPRERLRPCSCQHFLLTLAAPVGRSRHPPRRALPSSLPRSSS